MEFDNSNRGVLFRNDKGSNDRRPDYKGTINVGGTDYSLSAWMKSSKKGDKYLSLSVSEKRDRPSQPDVAQFVATTPPPAAPTGPSFDDDLPF